jgi:hypothetical protein
MAGFSFMTGMLPTALGVANAANRVIQHRNDNKQIKTDLRNQQQQIAIQSEKDESNRRDALRRAVARQRAEFGAQGIDTHDGSAEAILLGLTSQSDTDQNAQNRLTNLRQQALAESASVKQRKNLLNLNQVYDDMRLSSLFSK